MKINRDYVKCFVILSWISKWCEFNIALCWSKTCINFTIVFVYIQPFSPLLLVCFSVTVCLVGQLLLLLQLQLVPSMISWFVMQETVVENVGATRIECWKGSRLTMAEFFGFMTNIYFCNELIKSAKRLRLELGWILNCQVFNNLTLNSLWLLPFLESRLAKWNFQSFKLFYLCLNM